MFNGYVDGKMTKREFLANAGKSTAAGVTRAMIVEQIAPNQARAQPVAPDDPTIETMIAEYDSPRGHCIIKGLMAKSAGVTGPLPAVMVTHENRGLDINIEAVVRRTARAGYLAFGRDGLTPKAAIPAIMGFTTTPPRHDEEAAQLVRNCTPAGFATHLA